MGIAYNQTQIIQNALTLLGYPVVQSTDSGGPAAQTMLGLIDGLIAADLSSPNWRFATKAADLSLIAGLDPDFIWYHAAYQIPPDCLAIWQIWPPVPYEIYGEQLWTFGHHHKHHHHHHHHHPDPEPEPDHDHHHHRHHHSHMRLQIQYRHVAPYSMLPPAYIFYFTYLLACTVAPSITDDPKIIQLLQADMAKWRSQAMVVNTQGRPNQGLTNSRWVTARSSGTTYGTQYHGGGV